MEPAGCPSGAALINTRGSFLSLIELKKFKYIITFYKRRSGSFSLASARKN
jgi:hypothetical protein